MDVLVGSKFTLDTGRFYDHQQVLMCHVLNVDDNCSVLCVDSSRGMAYLIDVEAGFAATQGSVKSSVKRSFMCDDYTTSIKNERLIMRTLGYVDGRIPRTEFEPVGWVMGEVLPEEIRTDLRFT
ncbi:hypothetical protein VCHA53O466_40475 [Vibrio chagasii]|nr:hypothetical protein VCHA53O466_40475 [Vibrio chagasii]